MKTRLINQTACITRLRSARTRQYVMAFFALSITVLASSVMAQTVTMRALPLRVTVPVGVASSNASVLTIITASLPTPLATLSVNNIPSGAGATLSQTTINSNGTTSVTLVLTNDATLAHGSYNVTVDVAGDITKQLIVPLIASYTWSGDSFTNSSSTNWTTTGNWIGGVVPGAGQNVVFIDRGGLAATSPTNVIISTSPTVGSLRFAAQASTARNFNFDIQSGATLTANGADGFGNVFSMLRDRKDVAQAMTITMSGGGALVLNNPAANIAVLIDAQQNTTWDMRNLNNFSADVNRLGLGDYRLYPNYYDNGYAGGGTGAANTPSRFVPIIYLAKTNIIKAAFVDPNNYLHPAARDYALTLGNNEQQGTGTGNTTRLSLGVSNAFFLDSISIGMTGSSGQTIGMNFNAAGSYAIFRNIAGGRMSVWSFADAANPAQSGSNTRGGADFSLGAVDVSLDRLYMGRTRTNSTGFTIQATLTLGGNSPGSIFDVNKAYLGFQDQANLNTGTVASVANTPTATVTVNSNAIFRVNENLYLTYTTAAATGTPNYPENTTGIININNTGTVMASNIVVGGTQLATRREIVMTGGGNLIVTNGIGENSANGKLSLFNMTASALTLHVNGTTPRVYAKTLTLNGLANVINIASVANVGANYPIRIPLVSYETLSGSFGLGTLPTQSPTLYGWLDVDTGNQTVDLIITTNAPNRLVWKGNISSSWNHTDKNWVTSPGGIQTNFNDGNLVQFDDSATGSTDISVDETVLLAQLPGTSGMFITNTTKNYRFSGSSPIGGSAQLLKQGIGSLTLDGNSALATLVTGGTLLGSGTIGSSVTMQNGTSLNFGGTINGGLSVSNTTAVVNGIVNGGLNLRAGTLANTGTIAGNITVATNATLNNALGATINVTVPWSVPTNSTLINNGTINQSGTVGGNNGLTVNGTLKGVGTIVIPSGASADARVTVGPGGILMIGNSPNEITNITIATRLDFLAGSSTTFDLNNAGGTNDQILLTAGFITGKVNFGNGNSLGGTFVLNKLAGPAFNLGTSLHLFNLFGPGANIPDNANQALPGIFPPPAPGLTWDVSQMVTNLTLNVTAPPFMTNSITVGTNGIKSFVFEWPENYRGWRLERQTNSLAVGLESPSTNWVSLANSYAGTNTAGNSLYYPDITNNPSAFWFRTTVAVTDTNGAALAPATFFKLNYP